MTRMLPTRWSSLLPLKRTSTQYSPTGTSPGETRRPLLLSISVALEMGPKTLTRPGGPLGAAGSGSGAGAGSAGAG